MKEKQTSTISNKSLALLNISALCFIFQTYVNIVTVVQDNKIKINTQYMHVGGEGGSLEYLDFRTKIKVPQ